MGPGEVAWDVDRYNWPHGEEMAAVLIYVPGEEEAIDRDAVKQSSLATTAPCLQPGHPTAGNLARLIDVRIMEGSGRWAPGSAKLRPASGSLPRRPFGTAGCGVGSGAEGGRQEEEGEVTWRSEPHRRLGTTCR
jgi:hypothetical protein